MRLLNASNARAYDFRFADGRAFALIGTDSGLLPAPYATDRIQLSPGERAEIVVSVRTGERTVLRSENADLGGGAIQDRFVGGKDRFDVLELRAAATLTPAPEVPAELAKIDRLDPASAAKARRFDLTTSTINGDSMSMDRIDATVTKGTTEIWEITNQDGAPHNFHLHDVQFQVLSPPRKPELAGWKDTIFATPGETVRIIMRFATPTRTRPTCSTAICSITRTRA